jgi:membrane-anchored glycerophosphoryl diester phosphodiesterase (GDPDase)
MRTFSCDFSNTIGYFDLIYVLICFVTVLNKHSTASEMPESEKVKNAEKMKVKKARDI